MYKLYCFLAFGADGRGDPFATNGAQAKALLKSTCPAASGYVQSRALATQLEGETPAYAGCGELYFDNPVALLETWDHIEQLAPLWSVGTVEPIASIGGHNRIVMRLPEHHAGPSIKGVFPFKRIADMPITDFQAHWWHRHGPIAAATQGALFYPQCHPLHECYAPEHRSPDFDGVTELHWPDFEQAEAAMASEQMRVDQGNDAKNFAEPGSVELFFAQEETVLAP